MPAEVMEVADGIDLLSVPMSSELVTSIVVLSGEDPVLVDAGTPLDGPRVIRDFISSHGLPWPRTLVNTHFHWDHSGGNSELCGRGDINVLAHTAEGHLIAHPGDFAAAMTAVTGGSSAPPSAVGVIPEVALDGRTVLAGGRTWQVVHVPGHTWGHVALWCEEECVLIAGDAVQGDGVPYRGVPGQGTGLPYYLDAAAYRRSLERLKALGVETLVMAHGLPPWNSRVLRGAVPVRTAIDASLATASRIEVAIMQRLESSTAASLTEVAEHVRASTAMSAMPPQATLTVRGHLVDLATRGLARCQSGQWRLGDGVEAS